ncbi:MAG: cupin domain-containing protein [Rhodospirillales bacterium]|nr:cupin domain-containing protein [Rhodospirillales bacterium]MBO6786861.1 cupin domain-containing protein [Rhodospirillales bacterium]
MTDLAKTPDIRPWQNQFLVANVDVVAETPALRVIELTLEPGQCVPWHAHPENADIFYPIAGVIDIHEKMPETVTRIGVGETHTVPARRAHLVHNPTDATIRFLNIQGPGAYDYLAIGNQAAPDFTPKPMD